MADNYTKFGEVAVSDLVSYLRLSETTEDDLKLLGDILEAGRSFILTYTGQDLEKANTMPELTIALYVICESMYDVRSYVVDNEKSNMIVDSILGSRSINLL
jgi:hypothetical protein